MMIYLDLVFRILVIFIIVGALYMAVSAMRDLGYVIKYFTGELDESESAKKPKADDKQPSEADTTEPEKREPPPDRAAPNKSTGSSDSFSSAPPPQREPIRRPDSP